MLKEFIDFVDSVLPNVPKDTKDAAKYAIEQFKKEGEVVNYLTLKPLKELSQGDIITNIPFYYIDAHGSLKYFLSDAMVISTSCHIDQRDRLVLATVLPLNQFKGNKEDLKNNRIYNCMYIPDDDMKEKYVNFDYLSSVDKELILKSIRDGKVKRIDSLNQMGYYLFIIKLTVNFMRKEDNETLLERNVDQKYD